MTPESEISVDTPFDCMYGKESFSFTAGASCDCLFEQENTGKNNTNHINAGAQIWLMYDLELIDGFLFFIIESSTS